MIPAHQHVRDLQSPEISWPSVLGMVQNATAKRLSFNCTFSAHNTRQEPHHCISKNRSSKNAIRQNIITDRNLVSDEVRPNAIIYTFIMPTH